MRPLKWIRKVNKIHSGIPLLSKKLHDTQPKLRVLMTYIQKTCNLRTQQAAIWAGSFLLPPSYSATTIAPLHQPISLILSHWTNLQNNTTRDYIFWTYPYNTPIPSLSFFMFSTCVLEHFSHSVVQRAFSILTTVSIFTQESTTSLWLE